MFSKVITFSGDLSFNYVAIFACKRKVIESCLADGLKMVTLKHLADSEKVPMSLYQHLCSGGAQSAKLNGLAKVNKEAPPLRLVLPLPGSCYDNINNWLALLFSRVPGANIETSTTDMTKRLTDLQLQDDEEIFSLDMKSLYTNVPVAGAIYIACDVFRTPNRPRKSIEIHASNACNSQLLMST